MASGALFKDEVQQMKKALTALALAAGTLLAAPASAAIVVSFVPTATHIAIGGNVSVAMNISGLGDEILSAFDINMLFDNLVLNNVSVTHNVATEWPGGGVFGPSVFGVGNTGVIDYSLDDDATLAASQSNAFTVLTFGFTGAGDGTTFITLGADPDFTRNFVGLDFASLAVDVGRVCVAVGTGDCGGGNNDAPEPASFGLAGVALLAAGWAGRSRRRSRAAA
jgi:hypothetical protein